MTGKKLSKKQIEDAIAEINEVAVAEYTLPLEALLELNAEDRLCRISGILIKRHFAQRNPPGNYNPTEANNSWYWDTDRFTDPRLIAGDEYKILKEIRDFKCDKSWSKLQEISHEAGLMLAAGQWLASQISGNDKKFKDCYYATKSPEVNLLLNKSLTLTLLIFLINGYTVKKYQT